MSARNEPRAGLSRSVVGRSASQGQDSDAVAVHTRGSYCSPELLDGTRAHLGRPEANTSSWYSILMACSTARELTSAPARLPAEGFRTIACRSRQPVMQVESVSRRFIFADATGGSDWIGRLACAFAAETQASAISNSDSIGARNCGDEVENSYKLPDGGSVRCPKCSCQR